MNFELIHSILDLKLLKKSLTGLSLGLLALIPADWMIQTGKGGLQKFSGVPPAPEIHFEIPPLSSYEAVFERSVFFGAYQPSAAGPVLQQSLEELIKDYRLKGVAILDKPEAIFEDARTQQSIFVREGDKLGEVNVKKIQDGTVILSYFSEEKELRIQ